MGYVSGNKNVKYYKMNKKEQLLNTGWLILRIGIGISIFLHGLPKMTGGAEVWTGIGSTMSLFGINFAPAFWGFMAAFAETIGGILFALGLFFRPAAFLLTGTMVVALTMHLANGDSFAQYGHAMDLLIVFVSALLIGAGKYSLDAKFLSKIA